MEESLERPSLERAPETRARVHVADDQTILREALSALLKGEPGIELVATHPDVVLIDLALPDMDGLAAVREVKRRSPGTKALVISAHKSAQAIRAALSAGADGYLLKGASRAELVMAIESALAGKTFISPAASQSLVASYLEQHDGERAASLGALTERETQVLKRIAEGERNRDMADALGISVKTVEKHRSNLMRKLKLRNTAALTGFAIENRLLASRRNRGTER